MDHSTEVVIVVPAYSGADSVHSLTRRFCDFELMSRIRVVNDHYVFRKGGKASVCILSS